MSAIEIAPCKCFARLCALQNKLQSSQPAHSQRITTPLLTYFATLLKIYIYSKKMWSAALIYEKIYSVSFLYSVLRSDYGAKLQNNFTSLSRSKVYDFAALANHRQNFAQKTPLALGERRFQVSDVSLIT